MDVPVITMSEEEALRKLEAWQKEKHADQRLVREDCIKGYEALAEGKVLISLTAAIRSGGQFADGRPHLAIARADRGEVDMIWAGRSNECQFDTRGPWPHRGRQVPTMIRSIDMGARHGQTFTANGQLYDRDLQGFAQVPLLPAEHRPATGLLKDWFILWQVERWYARREQVQPDRDPMLLEHVAGDLYAVLAEWDLTELERAVMAGALRPQA